MRGLTRRGAGSIGLCWVLCVAVAGCTEAAADPPPSPPATADASPSPTPTPTAAPVAPETVKPERPAAMDAVDVDGAKAVARYFLELYPYVYATGDLAEWKAMSHPECIFCASVVTGVEDEQSHSTRSTGGAIGIDSVDGIEVSPGFYSVTFEVVTDATVKYDPAGAVVGSAPASRGVIEVIVISDAAEWIIRGVEPQKAS